MAKKLTKLGVFSLLIFGVKFYSQDGNVGINSSFPAATLEIQLAPINENNETNAGILIPKISKNRIANISNDKLVNGTLVFVDDIIYSGSNDKVSEITTQGFYSYDDILKKWVKGLVGNTTIYSGNGTLDSDRIITMNGKKIIFDGGNVGVGVENPSQKLEVAGTAKVKSVLYDSDARLKQNIKDISQSSYLVSQLRPVTYYWNTLGVSKGGDAEQQYGFIAQEVERVLPALVTTDSQGYKSVNYVAMVPILVKALQEKDKQIQELQQLKKEVELLKQTIQKINKTKKIK